MKNNKDYFAVNKETWNKKVAVHAKSNMYDMEAFKNGKSSLMSFEMEALGNVSNKSLLHLQCHFGQDTLSWSRMGAKCVGVDISDEAVKLARELNQELKLNAEFVCCNVLDTSEHISETFDIIFTSYGVIGWLPDLKPWGKMIAERLKSGGTFFIAEFHPIVWMFDYLDEKPEIKYGYNQKEVIYEEYSGTYADESSSMISKEYAWNHGIADVISALIDAGLQIEAFSEHDESPYNVLPNLIETKSGSYTVKDKLYPLIFTLKATKP